MKKQLFFVLFAAMASLPIFSQSCDVLLQRLTALLARGYMFGHQDDPFYGTSWEWERGRSDVLEAAGDYPAVMARVQRFVVLVGAQHLYRPGVLRPLVHASGLPAGRGLR